MEQFNSEKRMSKIQRAFVHWQRGTLLGRSKQELLRFRKELRSLHWKFAISRRPYIEKRIRSDVRMRLFPDSRLCREIYCGVFELKEQEFLQLFLRPGDVFIDVGANIGLFTLIAGRRVTQSGHVYAFEPYDRSYQRLLVNVELNKLSNVSCVQLALSDDAAQLDLNVSLDGYDAWSSLGLPTVGGVPLKCPVNTVTWDAFAEMHGLVGRVAMMKVDVEGWETRVLAGGWEMLARGDAPVLQVEFGDEVSRSAGTSCAQLYRALKDLGYQMFTYDAASKCLVPEPLRESYYYVNLIATKRPVDTQGRINEGLKTQEAYV